MYKATMGAMKDIILSKEKNKADREKYRTAKLIANSLYKELPDTVKEWAKQQLPDVMFYIKERRGKYRAYCSACGERVELTHARSGRTIECQNCGKVVTLKSGSRNPNGQGYWEGCAYIERVPEGWVQRLFITRKVINLYGEKIDISYNFVEEERDILFDGDGASRGYRGYLRFHENSRSTGLWISGAGRVHGFGWSRWRISELEIISTYAEELNELFRGSQYEYSAVAEAVKLITVNPFDYLIEYRNEPKLEMLSKLGLAGVIRDYFSGRYGAEDKRMRIRKIRNLKELGIESKEELKECMYLGVFDLVARKEVKHWKIDNSDRALAIEFVRRLNYQCGEDFRYDFITRERLFKYYITQKGEYSVNSFIKDYVDDYVPDCSTLGLNLKDTAVSMPRSLAVAHKWTADEIKIQKTQVYDALIEETYESLHSLVEWEYGEFCIIMPKTSREIMEEGMRQNHCVGRYCERVAKGESVILFVRRKENMEKEFYTLEIKKDMKKCYVVQCRGYSNAEMPATVQRFLEKYARWFNHRELNGYDGDSVMVRYYKAVHKKDGEYISGWDNKTKFHIGEWVTAELNKNPDAVAVNGLHVASLEFAQNYGSWWNDVAILEVETNIHDVVVPDAKDQVRTSKFRVIREVPMSEMGEWGQRHEKKAA